MLVYNREKGTILEAEQPITVYTVSVGEVKQPLIFTDVNLLAAYLSGANGQRDVKNWLETNSQIVVKKLENVLPV